jgi:phosphoribosylformimino-5-aminoimidazole carboxamide ribotide isomerase
MGGGLRDRSGIQEALDLGIERVVVGTRAILDPDWFAKLAHEYPGKLVVGLDAREGKLATRGWREETGLCATEVAQRYSRLPLAAIVYTDITKDGMLGGPNFETSSALVEASPHPVIASGGVTTIGDVLELRRRGISGCILGRTIYEGTIKLPELFRQLDEQGA